MARLVASRECQFGIMVDGAGIGSAMAANKVPGVRAAACYNEVAGAQQPRAQRRQRAHARRRPDSAGQARAIVDVFLSASCTAERHRARVQMIRDIERGTMTRPASGGPTLSSDDLNRIADRVRQLLAEGQSGGPAVMPLDRLAALIDHTLLRPEATAADIERLCDEARQHGFYSVCVNPSNVKQAATLLRGPPVKVCCVVGFPLGAQPPETKALEARRAIREGAREIDMVINVGALKGSDVGRRPQGHPGGRRGLPGRAGDLQGDSRDRAAHRRGEGARLRARR